MDIKEVEKLFGNICQVHVEHTFGSVRTLFSGHLEVSEKGYLNIMAANNHMFINFEDIISYTTEYFPDNFLYVTTLQLKDNTKISITHNEI